MATAGRGLAAHGSARPASRAGLGCPACSSGSPATPSHSPPSRRPDPGPLLAQTTPDRVRLLQGARKAGLQLPPATAQSLPGPEAEVPPAAPALLALRLSPGLLCGCRFLGAREAFCFLGCSAEFTARDGQSEPVPGHWPEDARLYPQTQAGLPAERPGTRAAYSVGAGGSWGRMATSGLSHYSQPQLCVVSFLSCVSPRPSALLGRQGLQSLSPTEVPK
ncbi:uncharacterized protein LOC129672243 [Psammomys obesus]|uniref:uncharacterized protein LOC129672243 n=1 Tax=Psammomys obesus TaxID=48139 RepID=UPI002452848F|nr:uncharacterized protein LOC129672243 [Psammomys obesus]